MVDLLDFQNVSKAFGSLEILREMSFSLKQGDSAAILGPSGAGKSTFLHIAGLMERASSGTVLLNGLDTSKMSDHARALERLRTIGFLFQFHHLLPDFNVLENVLIPARLAGDDLSRSTNEAKILLGRLGLSDRLTHRPNQLSGGEQQRAGLARALIRHPQLLLCDEPTGNLDQQTAQQVADVIWSEVKREGISVILVTHNEILAKQARSAYHLSGGVFLEN